MKIYRSFSAILLLFVFISGLSAEKQITDIEKTIIISCAYTDDVQLRQKALDTILLRYERDHFVDDEIMKVVIYLAELGIKTRIYEDLKLLEYDIEINLNAIKLLGRIGGQEALDCITSILLTSTNSRILLESIDSSTQFISQDYRGFMIALEKVMVNQHHINLDNMFAFTALTAIDHIVINTDTVLSADIIDIMMTYMNSAYIQKVLDYSLEILKKTYE